MKYLFHFADGSTEELELDTPAMRVRIAVQSNPEYEDPTTHRTFDRHELVSRPALMSGPPRRWFEYFERTSLSPR